MTTSDSQIRTASSKKDSKIQPFLMVVAASCFYMGSMSLTNSVLGVYLLPVSDALNITRYEFSLYLVFQGLTAFVLLPFMGNIYSKTKHYRLFMTLASLALTLSIFFFSVCTQLWQFCLLGMLRAFGYCWLYNLAPASLINSWFSPCHRGKMLGIASAFTGIGTFVWAPVFTMLIQTLGWRLTYMINGVLALILTLPFCLFIVRRTPQECGQQPYGETASEKDRTKEGGAADASSRTRQEIPIDPKMAAKTLAFYLIMVCASIVALGQGINGSLPAIAIDTFVPVNIMDANGAAVFGGMLISIAAVGNIVGKITCGWIADKFGMRTSLAIFAVLVLLSFVIWSVLHDPVMFCVAAFFFGMHNALFGVAFPLLASLVYGASNFPKIWSRISAPAILIGISSTTIVSAAYSLSGDTYGLVINIGALLMVVVLIGSIIATFSIGKYQPAGAEYGEKNEKRGEAAES